MNEEQIKTLNKFMSKIKVTQEGETRRQLLEIFVAYVDGCLQGIKS